MDGVGNLIAQNAQTDTIPSFPRPQPQPVIPAKFVLFKLGSFGPYEIKRRPVSVLLSHLQTLAITWDTQGSFSSSLASASFERGC